MDQLILHDRPEGRYPVLIVAFSGWPDAGEAATGALDHLIRGLPAVKFAEIDPEEFYDFTTTRPETYVDEDGVRQMRWPENEFHYFNPPDSGANKLLFSGTEPNLKWRAYSSIITSLVQDLGVELVVSLGALLDAVPHTRETKITGRASVPALADKARWMGIQASYEGPTGIHTAFMDACTRAGLPHASIWAHCPHYLTSSSNPQASYALLTRLRSLVDFDIDLQELREAGERFQNEVTQRVTGSSELREYVEKLERQHDEAIEASGDIPDPDDVIEELEDFLRRQGADE